MTAFQTDTLTTASAGANAQAPDSAALARWLFIPRHFETGHTVKDHALMSGKTLDQIMTEMKTVKANPNKNRVLKIDATWEKSTKSSTISIPSEKPSASSANSELDIISNAGIALAIIILFIFAMEKITAGAGNVLKSAFNIKRMKELEWISASQTSRNIACIFGVLTVSFILVNQRARFGFMVGMPLLLSFGIIVLSVSLYFIVKGLIQSIMDYANECSVFRMTKKFGYSYTVMAVFFILLGEALFLLFPNIPLNVVRYWALASIAIPTLLYLNAERILIFRYGFSIFFYILYLCTVEILPIVLIIKTITPAAE